MPFLLFGVGPKGVGSLPHGYREARAWDAGASPPTNASHSVPMDPRNVVAVVCTVTKYRAASQRPGKRETWLPSPID
jgi:hypothetical protein